jgi:ATP-dependent exoDNAse (exonuclease V) beta subunit
VGFVVGTLDLVYRDPETERLIVVDFKTDEVNDPRDLDEKKQRYAGQGAVYQRALREALALDYTPRFELWMLWSGDVVSVA